MQFHRWEKRWSYEKLDMKTKQMFGKHFKKRLGGEVIQFFRVDAAGFSRDVMADQRNVAGPRRCEDIGFAGDESSSGGLRNVSWETAA